MGGASKGPSPGSSALLGRRDQSPRLSAGLMRSARSCLVRRDTAESPGGGQSGAGAFACSDALTRAGLGIIEAWREEKGGRVLPVNGWGLEGTFAGFERPIRQARSIASAQRRTDAVGALVLGATRHGGIAWRRPIRCGCLRLLGCAHARRARNYRGVAGRKRRPSFARKWWL